MSLVNTNPQVLSIDSQPINKFMEKPVNHVYNFYDSSWAFFMAVLILKVNYNHWTQTL